MAIAVRAAGVNPKDVKLYTSRAYALARGQMPAFPLELGLEAAGVVTEAGLGAVGPGGPIEVGDEVIACRVNGAYSDRLVVSASDIVPKPPRLSWAQAASLMLVATTAYHALAAVRARPGQTILVLGASGSVGRYVVQLAALSDIIVIGSASARGLARVAETGARPVLSGVGLERRVRAAADGIIDAAIDVAGSDDAIEVSMALVADRSRIATIVDFERARSTGCQALGGEEGQDASGRYIRNNARIAIAALAQAGRLKVIVDKVFLLSQAAEAHEHLLNGGAGKIALTPEPI